MRRPRIGVSARIQYGDAARPGYLKKNVFYLEQSFARWLQSSGALVFLVPDAGAGLAEYAAELDGLVLQGGTDIAPEAYGEAPLRPEWAGDPTRDRYELELLRRFLDLKKPVLGVCRGQQLINVALGGTLYQDAASQKAGARVHQDPVIYDENYHDIEIVPGGGIAALYPGVQRARVNTLHHQAIHKLAPGLRVEAVSVDDGLVEAIRLEDSQYLVGVQWHPEFLHDNPNPVLDAAPLLREFVERLQPR